MAASSDGNTLKVVWSDNTEGNDDIWLTQSSDGGANWSSPVNLSKTAAGSFVPSIALGTNGAAHMVWVEYSYNAQSIVYCHYTSGSSCDWVVTLPGTSPDMPKIAVQGNNVYVVYVDGQIGVRQASFVASGNSGGNWGSSTNISNDGADAISPAVAVDSSNLVHVVWADTGNPPPVQATPTSGPTPTPVPGTVSDYLFQLYYRNYTPSTGAWSAAESVSTDTSYYIPTVATDSNNTVHVAWQQNQASQGIIKVMYRARSGGSWASAVQLSDDNTQALAATLAVDGANNLHVMWQAWQGGAPNYATNEILYRRSLVGSGTWSTPTANLSNNQYGSTQPRGCGSREPGVCGMERARDRQQRDLLPPQH